MLKGLAHIAKSTIGQAIVEPRRRKAFDRRSENYVHRTPSGLLFELQPGEYVDSFIAVEGIFERRYLAYLKSILKPGSVMLDVGANIGNHTIYLADTCRMIHCFEPNPTVANRLRRNIALNKLTNIKVHEFGLGGKDATLPFFEVEGNLGGSRFVQDGGEANKSLEIREAAMAVAELRLDHLDYIKIDVENMEEEVITALKPIIAQFRPIVSFEHHETWAPPGTFDRIRKAFDNYHFVYPGFAPEGSAVSKVLWNLRHDGGPVVYEIKQPEQRTYENSLALPDESQAFRVLHRQLYDRRNS